jgi:hypothetical protein
MPGGKDWLEWISSNIKTAELLIFLYTTADHVWTFAYVRSVDSKGRNRRYRIRKLDSKVGQHEIVVSSFYSISHFSAGSHGYQRDKATDVERSKESWDPALDVRERPVLLRIPPFAQRHPFRPPIG